MKLNRNKNHEQKNKCFDMLESGIGAACCINQMFRTFFMYTNI